MEFPKYTREENKGCKLTDKQIQEIKERRERGETYADIAKDYNITEQAVYYWCLDPEVRKQKNIKKNPKVHNDPAYFRKYRERKKQLHPELAEYEKLATEKVRKEMPEKSLEWSKKSGYNYYHKNKERLLKQSKEYQKKHLDKYREYNRKSREKKNNNKTI